MFFKVMENAVKTSVCVGGGHTLLIQERCGFGNSRGPATDNPVLHCLKILFREVDCVCFLRYTNKCSAIWYVCFSATVLIIL